MGHKYLETEKEKRFNILFQLGFLVLKIKSDQKIN